MMTMKTFAVGISLCLLLGGDLSGQTPATSSVKKQVIVFRPNQDAIRGTLVEARDDSIVVLSSEREVTIPCAEISRVILTNDQNRSQGRAPWYGAVLAGYGSAYILASSRDHGGYVESRDWPWYLLVVVPSAALGAGIGYLLDPGSAQTDEVFDFTGTDEAKARERSRLSSAANQQPRESKLHFTFQASHVSSNLRGTLPTSPLFNADNFVGQFNMLRRVQMTYSVNPELEVGLAWVSFGEPPVYSYAWELLNNVDFKSYSVSQTLDATGKYIVVSYKPLYHLLDSRLGLNIGGGLGIGSIDYNRSTVVSGTTPIQSFFKVSENSVSAYLFGELDIALVEGLSIGLVADGVFGPTKDTPAVPEAHVPAQSLSVGNASVGFTLIFSF